MPICQHCKFEYPAGATRCGHCRELVGAAGTVQAIGALILAIGMVALAWPLLKALIQ